ncbi:hypothetical protein BC830DRAFT_1198416 [Chytriomyces sp. MP71]|nr:hypothetical protein BC830DRAFT_1198416 [Chytriomyces sp. MP71]
MGSGVLHTNIHLTPHSTWFSILFAGPPVRCGGVDLGYGACAVGHVKVEGGYKEEAILSSIFHGGLDAVSESVTELVAEGDTDKGSDKRVLRADKEREGAEGLRDANSNKGTDASSCIRKVHLAVVDGFALVLEARGGVDGEWKLSVVRSPGPEMVSGFPGPMAAASQSEA